MSADQIELTRFWKSGGPLTKKISLAEDGSIVSDGSQCVMLQGWARREAFPACSLHMFAELTRRLSSAEAWALGTLRADLPDEVEVVTRLRLNGADRPNIIARTQDYIVYRPGAPGLDLLDFDSKGIPPAVEQRIEEIGGFWAALVSVIPELKDVGRVERASTSAGLYDQRSGEKFHGSNGRHIYVLIEDSGDAERFLKALHGRCWVAGFGWMMVGRAGQYLERSIVDRVCGTPERLVFEGQPVLVDPVAQDEGARQPVVVEGDPLDTLAACPPLSIVENARLRELRAKEKARLAGAAVAAREIFIAEQSKRLAERCGVDINRARKVLERQCDGVLLPDVELEFDDPDLSGATVLDVLANSTIFEGATLADPLEGIEYGRGKARIMRRADGTMWIHSFAHGLTIYELKLDFAAAKALLEAASKAEAADTFVRLALAADLDDDQVEELRNIACEKSGITKTTMARKLKAARQRANAQRAQEERNRRLAERRDPRPQIPAPPADAPWLPQMAVLSDILGKVQEPEPPMRDIDGVVTQVRVRRLPGLHAFSAAGANDEEPEETRLPPPEQPVLTRLSEPQLAELIERYIDYVEEKEWSLRSVHLNKPFVLHFQSRPDDTALPIVVSIATLPLVLGDGTLLDGRGLDRERGIVFRIPPELSAVLPHKDACTPSAVAEAMRFLTDEWLCDVATSYAGKCTLIAAALTIIERSLLPDRPVFWVTAGRRGGGKTTTLIMLLMAVTGVRPAAAAWSPNEEERRKALLAYLLEALPAIIWDNIPHGAKISCPHIERSCTSAYYSDRRLGVSETIATSAATVHLFTGNNVGPNRDLASRSLQTRLDIERADPENRDFAHPDPVGWTEARRAPILKSLYTVLLGNPLFREKGKPPETRFKTWWTLIGQAVEYAARKHLQATKYAARWQNKTANVKIANCPPAIISFKKLFLLQEQENDDATADLADALVILANKWPNETTFRAADVTKAVNTTGDWAIDDARESAAVLREVFFPKMPANQAASAKATGKRLKSHLDEPVTSAGETLILKGRINTHDKSFEFYVRRPDIYPTI